MPAAFIVSVASLVPEYEEAARKLARRLGLSFGDRGEYQLQLGPDGLQLTYTGPGAPGPVRADFVYGTVAHRQRFGGGRRQMIARAVGIAPGVRPKILDATAGLGHDAFVLAGLGCEVMLIERNPLVVALLEDGLRRALADTATAPAASRMKLFEGDAAAMMRDWKEWAGETPQVVYLDPMFPARGKNASALVKKEMRLFRLLVGDDCDAPLLFAAALSLASYRVVVKRPRRAPPLGGTSPTYALEGKSSRFDIYAKRALKIKDPG